MMKISNQNTGFWTHGFSLFNDALSKQEKALITPLQNPS